MRTSILFIAFGLVGFSKLSSQELDQVHPKENVLEVSTLKYLKDNPVGAQGVLEITSIQAPSQSGNPYVDLYYNIYAKLYYETVEVVDQSINHVAAALTDPDDPTLNERIELPVTLEVTGTPTSGPATVIKNGTLVISPDVDYATLIYHFNENEATDMQLHTLTSATLNFNLSDLDGIDASILDQLILELYVEYVRYEKADTKMRTKYERTASSLKENEFLIWWEKIPDPPGQTIDPIPANTLFELEWVHLPESGVIKPPLSSSTLYIVDFSNATSVQTRNRYYSLTNIYKNGYILSRVRTVRYQLNEAENGLIDKLVYGEWSMPAQFLISDDPFAGHYNYLAGILRITPPDPTISTAKMDPFSNYGDFNFEYSSDFGEEGRKNESLKIYDGSNRERQSLFYHPTDEPRSISGALPDMEIEEIWFAGQEKYYGYNGQERLALMPSPLVQANKITYQENINLLGGTKIDQEDYDHLTLSSSFPDPLDENVPGSAQYYSPSNKLYDVSPADPEKYSEYIPDAEGYPYSWKEFMNDGSGRVKTEYAPGEKLANDATGKKNTRYFYSKPTQSELDYIFGTNAGESRFYKKDITIDGNGSITLAYIDQNERTIATSIVGTPELASKMNTVPGPSVVFDEELLTEANVKYIEETHSFEMEYPIFVPVERDYVFTYSLNKGALLQCADAMLYCYDCDYDFVFQIIDEEGKLIIDARLELIGSPPSPGDCLPSTYKFSDAGADLFKDPSYTASVGGVGSDELTVKLKTQQAYTIIQKIKLKTDNLEDDAAHYLTNPNCTRFDEEHFINLELDAEDFTVCRTDYEDPCSFIRDSLREDFRYPTGAFVANAPIDANAIDYILVRTRREANCSSSQLSGPTLSIPPTNDELEELAYRGSIIDDFLNQYNLDRQPTFREFREEYLDFFIQYHPSICKLNTCELLNSQESREFDRILAESADDVAFEAAITSAGYSHVPSNATIALNTSSTPGCNVTNMTQSIVNNDWWYMYYPNNLNSSYTDPNHVDFTGDFALIAFDKALLDYCNTGGKTYGWIENKDQQFPPSRLCYFDDPNNWWNNGMWGEGTYSSQADKYRLLFSYFADYLGCVNTLDKGILEIAYDASSTNAERWTVFKNLYAAAKRRFIHDAINLASCPPERDFYYTNPTAGLDPALHDLYPQSWNWGRIYKWGEWWTGSSDCDIYIGEELKDDKDPYSNITDYNQLVTNENSNASIEQRIWDDLVDLMNATWGSTCTDIFTSNWTPTTFHPITMMNDPNPFDYIQTFITTSCDVYLLNLSSILTPYFTYYTNQNGTKKFTKIVPEEVRINCSWFDTQINSLPANLNPGLTNGIPVLTNGREDIDITDDDQIRFKNWMNYVFGLNYSFADYYDLAESCLLSTALTNDFGGPTDFGALTTKQKDIWDAVYNYGNVNATQKWSALAPGNLLSTLNAQSPGTVDITKDYLGFGSLGYENYHQDLFYLEDEQTTYSNLLGNMNKVFNTIKAELRNHNDFEDLYWANAIELNIAKGTAVTGTSLKINRAVRYANGTIWVRLVNSSDAYYDDYYFHYLPHNAEPETKMDYQLSDLIDVFALDFNTITPIFQGESMHYVWLSNASHKIMASTTGEIATAWRISKTELNNITGTGSIPLPQECEDLKYEAAKINGAIKYREYLDGLGNDFKNDLVNFCTNRNNQNGFTQSLNMNYTSDERQFTLYYYDQAGNLTKTVPPKGVKSTFRKIDASQTITPGLSYNSTLKQEIQDYRNGTSTTIIAPEHTMQTTYKYNKDNQIIVQTTPNGGTTLFWYDKAGRLALSQNEVQRIEKAFSYTLYDGQSRIVETGEAVLPYLMNQSYNNAQLWTNVHGSLITGILLQNTPPTPQPLNFTMDQLYSEARTEVVKTYYDSKESFTPPNGFVQENLRSRVATQAYFKSVPALVSDNNWEFAVHYSYDPTGNVTTLVNDYYQEGRLTDEHHRFKRLDYAFDPVSRNVLGVYYQLGKEDAFYHRYSYDAENRITVAETSRDGVIWDKDASYDYYRHGPLARTELGHNKVQGIDFAYTIQGWLKAVNSGRHNEDMNDDATRANPYAEDVFGFSLQYYEDDYKPIGTNSSFFLNHPTSSIANLYNGNIAAKSIHYQDKTYGKIYTYDQLNRINGMQENTINAASWSTLSLDGVISAYTYDANGNLKTLERYNGIEFDQNLDDMVYTYLSGTDKLDHVADNALEDGYYPGEFIGQASGNYAYDAIGNLTKDVKNEVQSIEWYHNGKIKQVHRDHPTALSPDLSFEYNALGNRTKKEVSFVENGRYFTKSTYYVRDAQGNVMATYDERDCRFENQSEQDGDFYYQYSHDFAYYTQAAGEQLPGGVDDLLNYLNSASFVHRIALCDQAALNLNNIPNIRGLIFPHLSVSDYLAFYPAAELRVLTARTAHYADYLFNNHFNDFLSMVNDRNEAYIQALHHYSLVQDFYNDFNNHFSSYYSPAQQLDKVDEFYGMNRTTMTGIITSNDQLFKDMLGLDNTQYNFVFSIYQNPPSAGSNLTGMLNQLHNELSMGMQNPIIEDLIEKINAILLTVVLDGSDLPPLFNGLNMGFFYNGLSFLSPNYSAKLNSILHHLHTDYVANSIPSPINTSFLMSFQPMAAVDWTQDTDGDFLDEYLHTLVADPAIESVSVVYFASVNMNQSGIYFNSGAPRPYVTAGILRNAAHPTILVALKATPNLGVTEAALHETEALANLTTYLKTYQPFETLLLNMNHDGLQFALSSLINYSPLDFAQDLEDHFTGTTFNFETLNDCSNDNAYLQAESHELYGSSRLGIMDAKEVRSDGGALYSRKLGAKNYELNDHLGNVVATVSDKKFHPQELVTNGAQNVSSSLGFQANLTGQYDRYPFGMEILSRSGDFSSIDYSTTNSKLIYTGLLDNCNKYSVSAGGNGYCSHSSNIYAQTYVASFAADNLGNPGGGDIEMTVKLDLSKLIPNLEQDGIYRVEIMTNYAPGHAMTSSISSINGIISSPSAGAGASQAAIDAAADKLVSYEMTGAQWEAEETNGLVEVEVISLAIPGPPVQASISITNISISQIFQNSSVPLAKRKDKAYRYGFNGQEVDNEWAGVAFGGGEIPLWEDHITAKSTHHEIFSNLDNWTVSGSCATQGTGVAIIHPLATNCGMESHSIFVEANKEYEMSIYVHNPHNNTLTIDWEYYNAANSTWNNLSSINVVNNGGGATYSAIANVPTDEIRVNVYYSSLGTAGVTATVDNLKISEELPKWQVTGSQAGGAPYAINDNGRLKIQTDLNWGGAQSEVMTVEPGKAHRLDVDFEMVTPMAAGPFIKVEQRNVGGSWSDAKLHYFTPQAGVQHVSLDFTPTKEEIRIYISTSTAGGTFTPPTEIYYDNFYISNGTTNAIVDGGVSNKLGFESRIYDAGIGRFLSRDPLRSKNVSFSPYHFSNNNPIYFVDNNGEDAEGYIGEDGKLYINVTYHAVSEGVDSYTDSEMRNIENLTNAFFSQAKGMKVTLSDGREVEIGGVKVTVKPGGDFTTATATAKKMRENVLIKGSEEQIQKRRESSRVEAFSTKLEKDVVGEENTFNLSVLKKEDFTNFLVGDELDDFNNAIIDETAHMMGTKHPEKEKGETRKEYRLRRESSFGDLERGNTNVQGELKLSQQDLQNIVNSNEFKLKENTTKPQPVKK